MKNNKGKLVDKLKYLVYFLRRKQGSRKAKMRVFKALTTSSRYFQQREFTKTNKQNVSQIYHSLKFPQDWTSKGKTP